MLHHRVGVVPDPVAVVEGAPGEVDLLVGVPEVAREVTAYLEDLTANSASSAEEQGDVTGVVWIPRPQPRHMTSRGAPVIVDHVKGNDAKPSVSLESPANVLDKIG